MTLTKEKITGITGSFLFCLIIGIILFFSVLKTVISLSEEGILVNFGNVSSSTGMFEPAPGAGQNTPDQVDQNTSPPAEEATPYIPPVQTTQQSAPQTAITQNTEQTISIPDAKKKEEQKRLEEQRRAQAEQQRRDAAERQRIQDEQRQQQAINSQVSGAFGIGSSTSSSQGSSTRGTGNEGSPGGNSDHGANTGIGGYGEFALSGRSIGPGGLPRPPYTVQEEGQIVIDITVDPKGNVIMATIGKGTNIDNSTMRKSALDAAKKARFNNISGNANQSGTITYKYFLK